jgi:polysaccharide export outer membrane protein
MKRTAAPPWGASLPALALALALVPAAAAVANAQSSPDPSPDASPNRTYTIGPMDVLQVSVWREPELTKDVTVRFDGMVTIPLLGDVQAGGRTPAEVAESLTKGLGRFIQAPRVTVGVGQAVSARFFVVGQVTRSGEYPLSGQTTVLHALALAGGFKDFAKTADIILVRQDQTVVPVNFKRIADGRDTTQNVVLRPGDTLVVP